MEKIINNEECQKVYDSIKVLEETLKSDKEKKAQLFDSIDSKKSEEYISITEQIKALNVRKKEIDKEFNERDDVQKINGSMTGIKNQIKGKKERLGQIVINNTKKGVSTNIFDTNKNGKNMKVNIEAVIPVLKKEKIEE